MASARPIIFVGPTRCETADAINDARCGVTVDPGQGGDEAAGQRLAAIIRAWADDPALASQIGARGRDVFVERYDQRTSCAAFERVIRSAWLEDVRVSQAAPLEPRPV
jgi:glycosyltransferase involved in cell wall biosynthesis